jgi:DNA polymerase III subunit delta
VKVQAARAESFLARIDPSLRVLLLFGPDTGLVRERAEKIVSDMVGSPPDPFGYAELGMDDLREAPSRLSDEVRTVGFGVERRLVWLRDATDSAGASVSDVLEDESGEGFLLLTAGELAARSGLRKTVEGSKMGAALGCYGDEGRGLGEVIKSVFDEAGVNASPDALAYLHANLGGDRGMTRSELQKLALYAGPGGRIDLAEASALVGDSAQRSLSDIALAAGDGSHGRLDRALHRAYREGASAIAILRAASRHFQRLLLARAMVDGGDGAVDAVGRLRPPVFWKEKGVMVAQVSRWARRPLVTVLARLTEAERQCKRSGVPQESVCNRVLLEIAQAGARRRR